MTQAEAADGLWVITHHATLRALMAERGLGQRATARRLIAMARGSLLRAGLR